MLFQEKRYKEAAEHFEQALKYRGDDAYARLGLAVVYFKLGKKKQALELFNQAVMVNFNWYTFPAVLKKEYGWTTSMINDWSELKRAGEK